MHNIAIITDTTCDLLPQLVEKYNIEVISGHCTYPDGREVDVELGWQSQQQKDEFFNLLAQKPNDFSTAPPNIQEYQQAFEKQLALGNDVIAIIISTGISGAYNFACVGKDNALKKYPNGRIEIVDSLRFGPGLGLMCVKAAQLRQEGYSFDELVKYLLDNRNRFHQAGWLDDLSFVAKKGRLTHGKAFFGQLAGVKPIGEFDYNGLTTVIGKAKGTNAAYDGLIKYIKATIENSEEQTIFIAQTNRYKYALQYKQLIEENFKVKEVIICDVYPSCAINIGPGLMAAYYIGKPISNDLSQERAILEEALSK